MYVASVALEQARQHAGGVIGILGWIHRVGRRGECMPAIVDLKDAVAVTAVADDVAPGVGTGSARFLGGHGGEELGVDPVAAGRAGDLRRESDALAGKSRGNRIDAHGSPLSHPVKRLTSLNAGSRMAKVRGGPAEWRGLMLRRSVLMDRSHKVDISGLLAGSRQLMLVADDVPIEPFEGLEFPEPVRVELELHQADRMLAVEGSVDARVHGPCDSCLEDVDMRVRVDVKERLDPAHGREVEPVWGEQRLDGRAVSTSLIWRSRAC